ncbi:MAG: amidohydrolase [Rhodospirillales bacterium]|nr:amidohydrolase [Rhodospirillales bacterium]
MTAPLLPGPTAADLARLESIYRDLHAHPELSTQESRTASIAAAWLREHGFETTEGIGGTGVVGLLRNGDGPTVLLRADMDALPVAESTGLAYASTATGIDRFGQATAIAHACGHDMHVAWAMGATALLARHREAWRGTILVVFQPAEETGQGARAMLADGMIRRFPRPNIALGQHVMPMPAGMIGWRAGTVLSAGDSWEVTLFGRGAHGSMPQKSIDPVVMAASAVMRLQTVVAREVAMTDAAVVTVGTLRAGMNENVIPDRALLRLNVRSFKAEVRTRVLAAIRRILEAEAAASGAPKPPEITVLSEFPLTRNDEAATRRVAAALTQCFGAGRVTEIGPATASEDFSLFGAAWNTPSVFWMIGGVDPARYAAAEAAGTLDAMPANHAPDFAPVIDPTLRTGIEAMLAAAGAWVGPKRDEARDDARHP